MKNCDDGKYDEPRRKPLPGKCVVCGTPLGIDGGMAHTGMCGPCCTGEAETLHERGETW